MLLCLWSILKIQCWFFLPSLPIQITFDDSLVCQNFISACNEFSELCLEIDDNFMAVTHLFRLIIHTHHSQKLFNMLYHMRFNLVYNTMTTNVRVCKYAYICTSFEERGAIFFLFRL